MAGERDLARLLADLRPCRRDGEFVVVSLDGPLPDGLEPEALIREDEGLTIVLERAAAGPRGRTSQSGWAWITLGVHSALEAVGLTAEVAGRLARAGISCNVLAGAHHDHLLVPVERADEALALLASP